MLAAPNCFAAWDWTINSATVAHDFKHQKEFFGYDCISHRNIGRLSCALSTCPATDYRPGAQVDLVTNVRDKGWHFLCLTKSESCRYRLWISYFASGSNPDTLWKFREKHKRNSRKEWMRRKIIGSKKMKVKLWDIKTRKCETLIIILIRPSLKLNFWFKPWQIPLWFVEGDGTQKQFSLIFLDGYFTTGPSVSATPPYLHINLLRLQNIASSVLPGIDLWPGVWLVLTWGNLRD